MANETDLNRLRGAVTLRMLGPARLTIGFLQGIIAWVLLRLVVPAADRFAHRPHAAYWSERHPMLFASLALITAAVPVIAIAEIGRMRRRTLLLYVGLIAAVLAGLAAYDQWRDPLEGVSAPLSVRVWPSFGLCAGALIGVFIANQLLEHRERGYALFSNYAEHFEDSWMRGFQLVGSVIFSLLVWGVLNLGAALFDLIHLTGFERTIDHNWFRCPALAISFAAAFHITDVRPALIRGVRTVVLTLLSWLLPLVVILGISFLGALLFVGLKPLWGTRRAAAILLCACALTVFLLNAAYKDGDRAALPPAVLRWMGRAAGPMTLLLTGLACYAIALRVWQYGWTPQRVISTAIAFVALLYSGGYTRAALTDTPWLKPLEAVNVATSSVIVAVLLLLLTPLADPTRVAVNSQVARLTRGVVTPAKFDYTFLRFQSGSYGQQVLAQLARSADPDIRARAARMQAMQNRYNLINGPLAAATEAALSHATVYPQGAQLPDDFVHTNWSADFSAPVGCLQNGARCEIYLIPYGSPGDIAILVRPLRQTPGGNDLETPVAHLYQRNGTGHWVHTGSFNHLACPGVVQALRRRELTSVRPAHDDLLVGGMRLEYSPLSYGPDPCATGGPSLTVASPHRQEARGPAQLGPAFGGTGGN